MGLFLICPQCQAKVAMQFQTCPQCGANLQNLPPEQRRYFLGQLQEVTVAAPEEEASPEPEAALEVPAATSEPEAPAPEAVMAVEEETNLVATEEALEVTEGAEKEPKKKKRTRKKKKSTDSD